MTIRFSLRLFLLLLIVHIAAAIAVYAAAVPLMLKFAAILSIGLSLIYYLLRDAFVSLPASWREISLEQNGVKVIAQDWSGFAGKIASTTIVCPYCIVFRVRPDRHSSLVSRVVFLDSLGPGEFRELCVGLKFA